MEEYRDLTGIGTVVNLSFNVHEEPVVCSPEGAMGSFLQGHMVDYLAISPFIAENPQLGPVVRRPPLRRDS